MPKEKDIIEEEIDIEEEEDDEPSELDQMIDQLGYCARDYWELDKCMDKHNHTWSKCQAEVRQLKKCWRKMEDEGLRTVQKDREMIRQLQILKESHKKI